jgi:hypothetical protein
LPVPDSIIAYRGAVLDENGDVTSGGKRGQVDDAFDYIANIQNPDILLIGYSAGADAALMFADEFVQTGFSGRIVAVVTLGATLSGYSEFRQTGIRNIDPNSDQTPGANLYDEVVISVLNGGIPILAFDDDNGQFSDLWQAIQSLEPQPPSIGLLVHTPSINAHFGDGQSVGQCMQGSSPPLPDTDSESGTNVNINVRTTVIAWLQGIGINPADY